MSETKGDQKDLREEVQIFQECHHTQVYRKGKKVYKVIQRFPNEQKANFFFKNEIKMTTYLGKHVPEICPKLIATETRRTTYTLVYEYSGVDLCELFTICSNAGETSTYHICPNTGVKYELSAVWWAIQKNTFYQQIKDIVNTLGEHNIVHLDIKSENFVFDLNTSKLKIIDFATAYQTTNTDIDPDLFRRYAYGTPLYMSPEAVLDCDMSRSVDIWATASTLHFIQTDRGIPGLTTELRKMRFNDDGTVCDKDKYRIYYDILLEHSASIIAEHYNPLVANLAKYFVSKDSRPLTI